MNVLQFCVMREVFYQLAVRSLPVDKPNLSRLLSVIKWCNDWFREIGQSFLHIELTMSLSKFLEINNFESSKTMSRRPHVLSMMAVRGFLVVLEMRCSLREILRKVAFVVYAMLKHRNFSTLVFTHR